MTGNRIYNDYPRPALFRPSHFLSSVLLCFSITTMSSPAQAAAPITPSGLNTQVTVSATPPTGKVQFDITGGTRPGSGGNLFHSFGDFSVPHNNIANFLNDSGLPTSNILGRVTGGNLSSIFGTIQTTGFGNANLFLMNPAGFLFGPNATVNVGGMVSFSSADYLRLADGVRFNAVPNTAADALLSTAPVAAYGFLGSNPGAITIQGSQLMVTDGTGIALVGGNITIQSGTPDGGAPQPARLFAPNGTIQLATAASPGEFDAATLQALPNVNGVSFTSFGSVTMAPGSNINVSGANTVAIRGGQFVLSVNDAALSTTASVGAPETISLSPDSLILSSNAGTDPGPDVMVTASNIQMDGASIQSLTTGDGPGGNISFGGQIVSLTNGAQVVSSTTGAGAGGSISVEATESLSISGFDVDGTLSGVTTPFLFNPNTGSPAVVSGIYSLSSGTKNGGAINITSPTLTMQDGAMVATINSGDGDGGNISIHSKTIALNSGASILSSTGQDFRTGAFAGSGRGGDITISAADSVLISGFSFDFFSQSQISTQTFNSLPPSQGGQVPIAQGGNISITAPNITVENGGVILSDTFGTGNGGNITLSATTQLSVNGVEPTLGIPSSITASSEVGSSGVGGQVTISASSVTVENRGSIQTVTSVDGGRAGDITLNVDNLSVHSGGSILSIGVGGGSSGHIRISANDTVSVSGGSADPNDPSTIFWSTIKNTTDTNSGRGANNGIDIHAGNVVLSDGPPGLASDVTQIESTSGAAGGTINITANGTISLSNKASILNRSGSFESGSVNLTASSITLDHSAVRGRTEIERNAGPIALTASNGNVELSNDSHILTSTLGSSGDAGAITVKASDSVRITGGSTIESSSLNGATGNAGKVTIEGTVSPTHSVLINGAGSGIFTDTQGSGAGGNIVINANTVTLENGGKLSATTSGNDAAATGGSITVNTASLTLNTGGNITASSSGAGAAGDVTVQCQCQSPAQSVLIDGNGSGIFTDAQGTGPGGSIFVNANAFTLQNGGKLSAATSGTAATAVGGTITVNANQAQLNSGATMTTATSGPGNAGNITVNADAFSMNGGAAITASSTGSGAAGSVTVEGTASPAQSILINGAGSGIFTDAKGSGAGGDITTWSNQLQLSNGSTISSSTSGAGNAGNILVKADAITISGGANITAASTGSGNAGTVTIQGTNSPANSFTVDGFNSGVFTTTDGTGAGGNILVNANDVALENGATISAKSSGYAKSAVGGTITINAGDTVTLNGATITASSTGVADAGSINISANNGLSMQSSSITTEAGQGAGGGNIKVSTSPAATVILQDSMISASVADGPGGGGNVSIDPQYVILQNSQILARAADGQGGSISITAGVFLPDANSVVSADSGTGVNGTVTIQTPVSQAAGKIQPVAKPQLLAMMSNQRCAALAGGNFSSFTIAGRDALPSQPANWLSSPLALSTVGEQKGLEAETAKEPPLLSLRQIAPPGFLTQGFAVESSGCQS